VQQQLCLPTEINLGNRVKRVTCPLHAEFDAAGLGPVGASERRLPITKEFALHQCPWDGGTVDFQKGPLL
jgi:hypothetical protein